MALNIVELTKELFSQNFISKFSSQNGESEEAVKKGIDASIPSILLGLIKKPDFSFGNVSEYIKDLFSQPNGITHLLDNPSDGLATKAKAIVQNIFGSKLSGVVDSIANYAGIKKESASALLTSATPATLATLNNHAPKEGTETNWTAYLAELQPLLLAGLPVGFHLFDGGHDVATPSAKPAEFVKAAPVVSHEEHHDTHTHEAHHAPAPKKASWSVGRIIMTVIILGILYLLFAKACAKKDNAIATTDTTEATAPDTATHTESTTSARESIKVILPNGVQLDAFKGGIEDKLVAFLKTDYKKLGEDSLKNTWFDFDNLNFELAKTVITPESQVQINNIAEILKAFPSAKIKIGGYTDKTGDESANLTLSKGRAEAVSNALKEKSVGAQVIGADGYGSQFAKYPASAPDDQRALDRHVSVSVR